MIWVAVQASCDTSNSGKEQVDVVTLARPAKGKQRLQDKLRQKHFYYTVLPIVWSATARSKQEDDRDTQTRSLSEIRMGRHPSLYILCV